MKNFPIPTEYCLIVNAFNQTSTLREAAKILGTDPASLVRKVQKLTSEFGYLQKTGNRWAVTEAGRRVAQWTDEVILGQLKLMDEWPRLRIASFTWLAEEMLIPHSPRLTDHFVNEYAWSFNIVAGDLEQELIHSRSDFVVTGHPPNDPTIAHKKIASYPWVVTVPYSWKKSLTGLNEVEMVKVLHSRPFIRHSNVNPEQILSFTPANISNVMVDGVIGLRSSVVNKLGWTALPAMSIQSCLNDQKVLKLEIKTNLVDHVSVWWLRARKDSAERARSLSKWISQFNVV